MATEMVRADDERTRRTRSEESADIDFVYDLLSVEGKHVTTNHDIAYIKQLYISNARDYA